MTKFNYIFDFKNFNEKIKAETWILFLLHSNYTIKRYNFNYPK